MASLGTTCPPPLDGDGKRLARRLTALLRHGKPKRLPFRADGYVSISQIKTVRGFESLDLDLARSIVHEDNKMRFSMKSEGGEWLLRANQGHTIDGIDEEQLLTRVNEHSEIPVAVHGTYFAAWPLIKASGLSKMDRNHIHLAKGLPNETGVISGMRKTCELLIYVNVEKAIASGITFFVSANGVILTSGLGNTGSIPASCFEKVQDVRTGAIIFGAGASENADGYVLSRANQAAEKGSKVKKNKAGPSIGNGGGAMFIPGGKGKGKGKGGEGRQFKWPEYVGWPGSEVTIVLKERFPDLQVVQLKQGAIVTMDHNLSRVRVFVDDDGVVAKPPKLG